MSHRIALATVLAALIAGPALAGGFAQPVSTPVVTPPAVVPQVVASTDWSGFYAGGQLGFGRLSADVTFDGDDIGTIEDDGMLYGVHAGYMRDFGRFVLGGEIDWDATQISLFDTSGAEDVEFGQLDSVARAKLRVGFDAGRVLPYVTAGVARASFSFDEDAISAPFEESYTGQFVGLGASFMATERVMVSIEALRHTFDNAPDYEDPAFNPDLQTDTVVNTVTLRGSLRF